MSMYHCYQTGGYVNEGDFSDLTISDFLSKTNFCSLFLPFDIFNKYNRHKHTGVKESNIQRRPRWVILKPRRQRRAKGEDPRTERRAARTALCTTASPLHYTLGRNISTKARTFLESAQLGSQPNFLFEND